MPVAPRLDGEHALTTEQVDAFRRDGHVVVRGLASPAEVGAHRRLIAPAAVDRAWDRRPIEERDTYGRAFLQAFNLWQHVDGVAGFVCSPRFARVAADLLEVDGVRLYHDQALFKEPHGGGTPWHQDQAYWPFESDRTITMWMPLADVEPAMGLMRFAAGSYRRGALGDHLISDDSDAAYSALIHREGFAVHETPALRAGDASFHLGWTLHGAPPNATDRMREAMAVIWFADGVPMMEPDSPARALDASVWLPGVRAGEVPAGPGNPLVFSRRAVDGAGSATRPG